MVEVETCVDGDWDRLAGDHPQATVFHRREWLDLIAAVGGAERRLYRLRDAGVEIGGLPLFLFRRGPFRIAASPPAQAAAPVLGPLVDDRRAGDALIATAAEARRLGAAYLEIRVDRVLPQDALRAAGFTVEPRSTYVLDLGPGPDALWKQSLNSGCRRAVRKAESSGVTVAEEPLADFLDRYYEMAASVFARWNREPPLSRADYARLARLQREGGCVKVFAARHEGRIVAAGVFPYGAGAVYYLDGVSDPAGQAARPNNLLHWEIIRWACAAGLQRYDMVGAGIEGVARFKETFGPALVPYTYAFRPLTPLARFARTAYARIAPLARAARYGIGRLQRRPP